MRRRALLATTGRVGTLAATGVITASAVGTAGCLAEQNPDLEVEHLENPADFERNGVPLQLDADATRADAWTIGTTPDGDTEPIDVAVVNDASERTDCSVVVRASGDERLNARVDLPPQGYVLVGLRTPVGYEIDVGHRPDLETIGIDDDSFDCNAKTVTALIAADGSVDTRWASTDMDCGVY